MKKFLIISAVFVVLVLGLVAQHHNVELEDAQVAPNAVESIQPRLTKSEKIEQNYPSSQDPIGEIPVIFEQIASADVGLKPMGKLVVEVSPQAVTVALSPKAESNMNESISLLAHQVAGHMAPNSSINEYQPDMGSYPFAVAPGQQRQRSSGMQPAVENQSQELVPDQTFTSYESEDEPRSSRHSKRSKWISSGSYNPISANVATSVTTPAQPTQVSAPAQSLIQSAAKPTVFGRVKNGLSKLPKWLCGLPLVAGAYALLKNPPTLLEAPAEPESEKIDVAGHVHDKLQELQDEYLAQKDSSDQSPTPTPEVLGEAAGPELVPVQESALQSQAVSAVAQEASTAIEPNAAIEPKNYPTSKTGGMLSATRTLLSPVRSLDQVPDAPAHVVEALAVAADVHAMPIVSSLEVAAPQQGMVSKALSDCYGYFARRLSSPMGVLALATKVVAIGAQVAPMAYAARQAQFAQRQDLMLEDAVMHAVRNMKPLDASQLTVHVVPVEGASLSYAAQLAPGNVSIVAQQLGAQLATLRLR